MQRLSFTIFLAVLASLLLFALAVVGIWTWSWQSRAEQLERRIAAIVADPVLQDATSGRAALQRALTRLQAQSQMDLAVVDAGNRLLAQAGRPIGPRARGPWPRHEGMGEPGVALPPGAMSGAMPETTPGTTPGALPGGMSGALPGRMHGALPGPMAGLPGARPAPDTDDGDDGPARGRRWVARFDLPGDRWLLVRPPRVRPPPPPVGLLSGTVLLVLAVALVAWPVSRRITRRLERLQRGVEQLGAGDLKARVSVEGRDEVAALARSVNASAARIEELVATQSRLLDSQRRLLANASHELRSPLARIRLALELLLPQRASVAAGATAAATEPAPAAAGPDEAALRAEMLRNVAELDRLVDEILTASRIDAAMLGHGEGPAREPVDVAGLAAEEAARVDAEVEVLGGQGTEASADPRLLRRLLRNLLENARRYHRSGTGEPVQLLIDATGDPLRLEVRDRGPGVPEAERERIFEAFYRVDGHSENAGGVGLGLALARQIARAHGGDVRHEPREGGGSVFVVMLPRRLSHDAGGQSGRGPGAR